jgi:two-component system cell cycle response regulator
MGFRILVIEDNADNLELMTYLLKAFGHTTLVAADGISGLDLARCESPDLILCDIQMPGMSGYQVVRELQNDPTLAQIPRVAVTALAMVGDREKVLAAGFEGYIAKPIVPEDFVPLVEKFLKVPSHPPPCRPIHCQAAVNPRPAPANGRPTILVVDDSRVNRSLARSILEPFGYHVVEACQAQDALTSARYSRPDLILCDVHMPGGDGYECISLVKADPGLRRVPFVFLSSAVFGEEVRNRCLKLGAERYIARPVEPETLLREIEDVLHGVSKKDSGERG